MGARGTECPRSAHSAAQTVTHVTGQAHLVVLDCFSDVLRWNPPDGIQPPNARRVRQTCDASRYDLCMKSSRDDLCLTATVMERCAIDWRFSVEANRVCFYQLCTYTVFQKNNTVFVRLTVDILNT